MVNMFGWIVLVYFDFALELLYFLTQNLDNVVLVRVDRGSLEGQEAFVIGPVQGLRVVLLQLG